MNTNAISTLPQVDLTSLTASSTGSATGSDFAQVLAALQTSNTAGFGLTSDNTLSSNLSGLLESENAYASLLSSGLLGGEFLTEDLLAMSNLTAGTIDLAFLEGLASEITNKLSALPGSEEEEELLALLASLQTELQQLSLDEDQIAIGEQLMMLLAQMTGQTVTPALQTDGTLAWSLQNSTQALSTLANASPQDVLQWLQGKSIQTASQALTQQSTVASQEATANTSTPLATTPTLDTVAPTTNQETTVPTAETGSQNSTSSGSTTSEGDEGQAAFNASLPLTQQGVVTTGNVTTTSATPAFLTQMQTGIENGLQAGLEEFQVKLMPEGLGEVIVQLKSTESGLTLTLIAQNAETQRMLAAELEHLREGLRPLKVEVQEVLSGQDSELLNQQQDSQEQRNLYWRAQTEQNYVRRTIRGEPVALEQEESVVSKQPEPERMLDAYI